jgi:hypothetical protein
MAVLQGISPRGGILQSISCSERRKRIELEPSYPISDDGDGMRMLLLLIIMRHAQTSRPNFTWYEGDTATGLYERGLASWTLEEESASEAPADQDEATFL